MQQMGGNIIMKIKKTIGVISLGVVLALTGCGNKVTPADNNTSQTPETTAVAQETGNTVTHDIIDTLPLNRHIKINQIGLVTSEGGIDDESFNQSAWEGLQRTSGSYDCDVKYVESDTIADFKGNVDSILTDDMDLVWGIGYSCAQDMLDAATEHPDVYFAMVDNTFEDLPSNMTGVIFRGQEPAFLAGFIAGSVTETDKIGFVGGEENEVIDQFRYGFQGGVAYAAARLDKEIEVYAEYAGTFSDESKGKELADKLYDEEGCDIVFQAAGATGLGVIESAKEHDLYVIGIDKDQSYLAPDNMLTSVLKYVSVAIYTVSGDYILGIDIGGKTVSLGLSDNSMGISGQHTLYSDEIYDTVMTLQNDIIAGNIVPPSNGPEYGKFVEWIWE